MWPSSISIWEPLMDLNVFSNCPTNFLCNYYVFQWQDLCNGVDELHKNVGNPVFVDIYKLGLHLNEFICLADNGVV